MTDKIFNSNFIRIFVAVFLVLTGNQIIMVVLPLYLDSLGKDPSILGIATSLSALAAMSARPMVNELKNMEISKLNIVYIN